MYLPPILLRNYISGCELSYCLRNHRVSWRACQSLVLQVLEINSGCFALELLTSPGTRTALVPAPRMNAVGRRIHARRLCRLTSTVSQREHRAAVRDFTYHERRFLKALDEEGVQFLVVGSWAPALHGVALEPADLNVLIGTDAGNVQAFFRARDRLEPIPGRRILRDVPSPFQQDRVTLGKGHADALTAVRGVDFAQAWERREIQAIGDMGVPVLARADLVSALQSSERPQDRERLTLLRQSR